MTVSSEPVAVSSKRTSVNLIIVRVLCLLLTFLALTVTEAQQPKKIPRIGYLGALTPDRESSRAGPIRLALRELGYIEGRNIAIEYRYAEGNFGRLRELATELVRLKVDVIVVGGGFDPVKATKDATKIIPIVMTGAGADPVEAGLVESLARPGGNVTGITLVSRELGGKRLELLKETVPKLTRVAVLFNPTRGSVRELKHDLPVAARALELTVRSWEIRDVDGIGKVFAALNKERPDGLYVPGGGPLINTNLSRITDFALKSRLPAVYQTSDAVAAGGLISYAANVEDSYRRVAWYIDRILKGAKPAELPVEQPTKFELAINLNTAKEIGLTIPPHVLARADKVIK